MKRAIRSLSVFSAIFLFLGLLFAVFYLPKNFSHFYVTLHRDSQRMSERIGPSFGGIRLDDFEPGSQTRTESHIAWISPKGITLRLRLRRFSHDRESTSIDRLVFLRTDRAERIDVTPQIYLTSEIQSN